jgi:putative ATP-dependent endonuclease of OLD family
MKLIQAKLKNWRCYKDEVSIDLDDLVVFVGKNDSGKSSVFDALDLFFDDGAAPDKDDVCVHADDTDIQIACVFTDLPPHLVIDTQRPTSLADEYLLNSRGHLEIVKIYDCSLAKPKCSGVYARAAHPTADSYADLLSLTNAKLKQRASSLHIDLSAVNQTVNTDLRRAIWAHAGDLQLQEIDVPLKAEAAKEIWEQLKKHLPVYAVFRSDRASTDQDEEAQDPMKAAVKEAIRAQEDVLNGIAEKVKAEVQEIANRTIERIAEMSPDLARKLTPRVSTKSWDTLFSVSLTGDEGIPINKRGSGVRRLVLLNFFRAKVEKEADEKSSGLIYAIEELETSQHPHNQLMLVNVLEDLAERPGCQVFLTTHTPVLARRFDQDALRLVTSENGRPIIRHGNEDGVIEEIVKSLGVLPDHNIKVFFGVEGRNDIAFLRCISKMLRDAGEDVPDLGAAEDAGHLVFVPLGGSSLDLWVSRLQGFNRPEFYLFDRDTEPPLDPHYKAQADAINQRPNCHAWHTQKRELENYIHRDLIASVYSNFTGSGDDFEDMPTLFAKAVHEASASQQTWADVQADAEKLGKKVSNAKKRLCSEFAAKMTPQLLTAVDPRGEVRGWLREVGSTLNAETLSKPEDAAA